MRYPWLVLTAAAVMAWPSYLKATVAVHSTGVVPCGPKVEFLCEAAAMPVGPEREAALERLLARGLESPDAEIRTQTFAYLKEVEPCPLDPRPLRASLKRYDELSETGAGTEMVEEAGLFCAPRDVRLREFERAIVDGQAKVGEHTTLDRTIAMRLAASQGLIELREVIREHYPEVPPALVSMVGPLDGLLVHMELTQGAENQFDAGAVAVRRLAATPADALASKIETSVGWRRAISDVAMQVCKSQCPSASDCAALRDVVERQGEMFSQRHPRKSGIDPVTHRFLVEKRTEEEESINEWFGTILSAYP